jgi:hypothetical protein
MNNQDAIKCDKVRNTSIVVVRDSAISSKTCQLRRLTSGRSRAAAERVYNSLSFVTSLCSRGEGKRVPESTLYPPPPTHKDLGKTRRAPHV